MVAVAPPSLSDKAEEELRVKALLIKAPVSAARLWGQVLTEPDRQRLGGDLEAAWLLYGTVGMWQRLRGVSAARAIVDVAYELGLLYDHTRRWLLRELGEIHDDPDQAIEAAVASIALVLVDRPRTAYWQGHEILVDWDCHPALWDYFWELCRHAKANQPIDHTTFRASRDSAIVTKQKSRLRAQRHFPRALGALIRPVRPYGQRLDLRPDQIRLFELISRETLREYAP